MCLSESEIWAMRIACGRAAEVTENCELYHDEISASGSSSQVVNAPQVFVTNVAGSSDGRVLRRNAQNVECKFQFILRINTDLT